MRALELRKAGASYREIAAALDVDVHTAYGDVLAEITALRDATKHDADQVKEIELQRCDAMTKGLWSDVTAGSPKAVLAAIRVSERRSRLLGLDAAVKTEHSGSVDLRSTEDKWREREAISRYLEDEDLKKVATLYSDLKREWDRVEAEVEKIIEPARQQYLARQQHFGGRS